MNYKYRRLLTVDRSLVSDVWRPVSLK
jgi:hypothetical protein